MKKTIITATLTCLFSMKIAAAYVDPGTGAAIIGSIWPLIVAFFSAIGAFLIKIFWKPIKGFFSKIFGKKED